MQLQQFSLNAKSDSRLELGLLRGVTAVQWLLEDSQDSAGFGATL